MTNEAILEEKYVNYDKRIAYPEIVLDAMDLARKDEAVAFAEWMDSEGKFYSRSQSFEQLYSIFKQQNEKQ